MMPKIYNRLLIFLLLLSAGSMYFVLARNPMTIFLLLFVLIPYLSKERIKKVHVRMSLLIIPANIVFLFIVYLFGFGNQSIQPYLFLSLVFMIGVLASSYLIFDVGYAKTLSHVEKGLQFICYHALFSALLVPLLMPFMKPVFNEVSGWDGFTFFYLFFISTGSHLFDFGIMVPRNRGLFWEPSVLQFFLNFHLYIQLFEKKKRNNVQIILVIIVIITTFSTTGFLIMTGLLFMGYYSFLKIKPYYFPVIFIFLSAILYLTVVNVQLKFTENVMSGMVRIYDLFQQWVIAFHNPLTGVGLDAEIYYRVRGLYTTPAWLEALTGISGRERGSANSIMFLMGTTGILYTTVVLFGLLRQQFFTGNKLALYFLIFVSVSAAPIMLRPLFFMMIASGWIYTIQNKQEKKLYDSKKNFNHWWSGIYRVKFSP